MVPNGVAQCYCIFFVNDGANMIKTYLITDEKACILVLREESVTVKEISRHVGQSETGTPPHVGDGDGSRVHLKALIQCLVNPSVLRDKGDATKY